MAPQLSVASFPLLIHHPIQLTIRYKERLNRGQGAVENKYGRVVKEAAWKPYVAQCAARFVKVRRAKRKVHSKLDEDEDEDEDDDGEDHNEEEEEIARRPLAKKTRMTLAAAAGFE